MSASGEAVDVRILARIARATSSIESASFAADFSACFSAFGETPFPLAQLRRVPRGIPVWSAVLRTLPALALRASSAFPFCSSLYDVAINAQYA